MYEVVGGVHTDTKFEQIIEGKQERYGPFETLEEATDVWRAKMWLNVDNALHRLIIVPVLNSDR